METMVDYGLDLHCRLILDEYREMLPVLQKMEQIVSDTIKVSVEENNIYINAYESRIKSERSLAGKLARKGSKYHSLGDVTDVLGTRVITIYLDEVDKMSSIVENVFDVDWENSVDKRKMHDLDSFGYNSLHFICRIPKSLYYDPEMPQINELRFEVQMRTALQHVWSTINHDSGYKSGIEIPKDIIRSINCLAGLLELADTQFSTLHTEINNYRRKVNALLEDRCFEQVPIDESTYSRYIQLHPFDNLVRRIAAINQAEVFEASPLPYYPVLKEQLGLKTLKDLETLIIEYAEDAFQLAAFQLGKTDLDIISSNVAIQNLCICYILRNGGGEKDLKFFFDTVEGQSEYNIDRARKLIAFAAQFKMNHPWQT